MNGTTLNGRYQVETKIGEGGFGAVYRGIELATNRAVALKLLHPDMARDSNLVARFRREGLVACALKDPHTITTYEFDQTPDGTLYIAMELLQGKSLNKVFHESRTIEWKRMFRIILGMCSSLREAHERNIVHRDLKPDNVYLENIHGNPEFVKVLDFGMAKVAQGDPLDPKAPKLTTMGQTLGTLEYMSPEQIMGAEALDNRSDIYALGVLAYEMITGRLPYPDVKNPAAMIMAQLKETFPPPSVAAPNAGLPPEVDALITKCLEKRKDDRFRTVDELAVAITQLIAPQQAPVIAPPPQVYAPPPVVTQPGAPGTFVPLTNPPPPSIVPPMQMQHAAPAASSKAPLFIVIAIVVIGAVAAVAVFAR